LNFWCGDKSANATAAFHNTFAFKRRKSVTCRHEAHFVQFGEVAFGAYRVAGPKLAGVDALPDGGLDALVGRNGSMSFNGHAAHLDCVNDDREKDENEKLSKNALSAVRQ
jgi:hypothetical protein